MKKTKRNEIARAVEAWRAKRPPVWTVVLHVPIEYPRVEGPIHVVDLDSLPRYTAPRIRHAAGSCGLTGGCYLCEPLRLTPYEFTTTWGDRL